MEKKAGEDLHPAWGWIALGFYATHAAALIRIGDVPHLLWSCHLANVVLAAGILLRRGAPCGVALMWLAVGMPTWVASALAYSGFFQPTSTFTHVFGLVLAGFAVRAFGMPRGTWWRATAGLIALWLVSRPITPPGENVNVTHDYWFGWEGDLVPFPVYVGILWLTSAAVFFVLERIARRIWGPAE